MFTPRRVAVASLAVLTAADSALSQSLSIGSMFSRMQNKTIEGVTVVTHGFQFTDGGGDALIDLAETIRSTIATQTGGNAWLLDYDVPDDRELGRFDLSHASAPPAGAAAGHVVLLWDWAAESNRPSPAGNPDGPGGRFADSAGDALFSFMRGLNLINPRNVAASPKLHMIAHSFGSGVTSEAVERMARYNVRVNTLTYIDPHDFDQAGVPVDQNQQIFTMGKPAGYGATVWNNVDFADVYYQTRGTQGGLVIGTDNPEGRPIPGAHNRLLDTELPAGNPYGNLGTDSDHSYAWHTFYAATVTGVAPTGTFAPQQAVDYTQTGWAFSVHNANQIATTNGPRNFYGQGAQAQDHEHSETAIVNRTTGQPNLAGLSAAGLTAQNITDGRFDPAWQKTEIANGDLSGGYGRTIGSSDLIAGWSHHGGGGSGFVEEQDGHFIRLNFNEDNCTHNFTYVPINAKELRYNIRVVDDSSNDVMTFRLGDADAGQTVVTNNIDVTTVHPVFQQQSQAIPAALRGQTTTFGFFIEAPGIFNSVDSEVDLDNFRWGMLNPILQTSAGNDPIDFGSMELNENHTINQAFTLKNVGEAESVIDVQRFLNVLSAGQTLPHLSSPDFAYAALTAGGSDQASFALRFAAGATAGVFREKFRIATSEGSTEFNTLAVVQPTHRWDLDGDGQWGVAGNWRGPIPDGEGAAANFYSIITEPRTITLVNPVSVGQIAFANRNTYTITGQEITMDNGAANAATIAVSLGNHRILAPLKIDSDTIILGPGGLTVDKVSNLFTITLATRVTANEVVGTFGDLKLNDFAFLSANYIKQRFIEMSFGSFIKFNPQRTFAGRWSSLQGLDPNEPFAIVDIGDNIVIVDSIAPVQLQHYRKLIGSGYGQFDWRGLGITSFPARENPSINGIGFAQASNLLGPAGGTIFGQEVEPDALIIRFTLFGDSDLNGVVDINDFSLLAANFNIPGTWYEGDYDYDGVVLVTDFSRLAANFNQVLSAETARAVPEPGISAVGVLALACRRRRRPPECSGRLS